MSRDGPRQRYRLMERLERLWATCEPHLDPPRDEDGVPLFKADPRFVEAGIRILDRIARVYRLDSPGGGETPAVGGGKVEIRELVSRAVAELEARTRDQGS